MRLDRYLVRRFLISFLMVFGVFFGIVFLIDLVEQMRRFKSDKVGVLEAAQLAFLNAPSTLYQMLPLLVVLATIMLFLGLARTSEMVVTRASGRSALRSVLAPVLAALMIGIFGVTVINPIIAATGKQYNQVAARYKASGQSVSSVSEKGIWLRQASASGQIVVQAKRANLTGTRFFGVTFYGFDSEGRADFRIQAAEAVLRPGAWIVSKAKQWDFKGNDNAEAHAKTFAKREIASDLTHDQIRDSLGNPQSIPIWELPGFIRQLDQAGFSALQHRVWLQMELANPLLLASMVLIGATFTMRHTRFGRTGLMVLFAVMLGFAIFFLRNFAQVLGQNGQISVIVAAWAPPLAGIFLSLGLLFHTEDG